MRRNGPAGSTSATAPLAVVTLSFTATPVLLMASVNAPVNDTCGTFSVTVALTCPARPAGVITNAALWPSTCSTTTAPFARFSDTLVAATSSDCSTPLASVTLVNEKSPRSRWPSTSTARSTAVNDATGPAPSKRTTTSRSLPAIGSTRL